MKRTRNILFNGLLSLLILAACGKSPEQESVSTPTTEVISETATQQAKQYYINTVNNEKLAAISIEENQNYLSIADKQFFGLLKKADKRKYHDQNDQMQYAIKYSEDGFKLRDQNEELLWKIKIDDKIKIANNEEMSDAYKISRSSESKIKLKKEEEEINAIRVKADSPLVTINDKYSVHSFGNSLALGILLIEEIPDEQKFILCAELLKQGK
ncbi:MAG: hypothetical protein AAFN93_27345 [Bacteroidota bacterium]